MVLSSPVFLFLFLPLALTTYLALPRSLRRLFLLGASLLFFQWGSQSFIAVLLLSILFNYALALCLPPVLEPGRPTTRLRTAAFSLTVVFNLCLLLTGRFNMTFGAGAFPSRFQFSPRSVHPGVSFFSLALMSYVIDVYRGKVPPARSPLNFALYVSLFTKIMAGPIARYRDVAEQIARLRVSRALLASGVQRFITGLAKKVLIADTLGRAADDLFSVPVPDLSAATAWLGALCYALQIYYDFSGYSDIAIGLGRMFGIEILENFNYPYVSRSLREFWRRWHISLSTWLRDYIHLPLAYAISRRIQPERLLNVRAELWAYSLATLVTMLFCGLWHGVSWGCVLWGLWHGLFLILETSRSWKVLLRRSGGATRYLLTQWVVLMGWVVFRAGSMAQSALFLRVMYGLGPGGARAGEPLPLSAYLDLPLVLALIFGLAFSAPLGPALGRWSVARGRRILDAHGWIPAALSFGRIMLLLVLLLATAMSVAGGTYTPFVYQQF